MSVVTQKTVQQFVVLVLWFCRFVHFARTRRWPPKHFVKILRIYYGTCTCTCKRKTAYGTRWLAIEKLKKSFIYTGFIYTYICTCTCSCTQGKHLHWNVAVPHIYWFIFLLVINQIVPSYIQQGHRVTAIIIFLLGFSYCSFRLLVFSFLLSVHFLDRIENSRSRVFLFLPLNDVGFDSVDEIQSIQ